MHLRSTCRRPELYGDADFQQEVMSSLTNRFGGRKRPPKYTVRPIVSSSQLVQDTDKVTVWKKFIRHFAAIEMEFAGVYLAAKGRGQLPGTDVPVLTIRGISDIVGLKRKGIGNWTDYARHSAAAFTKSLIAGRFLGEPRPGHPPEDSLPPDSNRSDMTTRGDPPEYQKRLREAEERNRKARETILRGVTEPLLSISENGITIFVVHGDVRDSLSELIVSSDDTRLTAEGGIAKRILESAGGDVRRECSVLGTRGVPHGYVAATTAGAMKFRGIIHAAVVDKNTYQYRYPDERRIKSVVRHALGCAAAFGARSIAFPVIGGGTGAKLITPWESITTILSGFFDFIWTRGETESLKELILCIYNTEDIKGSLSELAYGLRDAARQRYT